MFLSRQVSAIVSMTRDQFLNPVPFFHENIATALVTLAVTEVCFLPGKLAQLLARLSHIEVD